MYLSRPLCSDCYPGSLSLYVHSLTAGGGEESKYANTSALDSADHKASSSPDLDNLSVDNLPLAATPVPCIAPILDSNLILSGLERDKKSPSRFSVDVECESVVSDYSEVGGPLKDLEREVHYLDRDALTGCDLSVLDLTAGHWQVERREDETEEEFQRRLRKVNLLSLAQEFAELKKIDAQACPINFHRHNAGKALRRQSAGSSPYHSRGQSLERPRRIVPSKPHRDSLGEIHASDSSYCDGAQLSMTSVGGKSAGLASKHNHFMDELPVNEARRRSSNSDLPANMRPDRQGGSGSVNRVGYQRSRESSASGRAIKVQTTTSQQEGSVEEDGDFDVYNIETTVPNLDWDALEKQLELAASDEQARLEVSCFTSTMGSSIIVSLLVIVTFHNGTAALEAMDVVTSVC